MNEIIKKGVGIVPSIMTIIP